MAIERTTQSEAPALSGYDDEPSSPMGVEAATPSALNDNPTVTVDTETGDQTFDFGEPEKPSQEDIPFDANLAEYLDDGVLQELGRKICEWADNDDRSRDDWKKAYTDGLTLLGLKIEDRSDPWMGACGVFHPVLAEAVVRFQSQAIMEIFPASGPVKTKIVGKWTLEKEQQAKRVQEEMNYQVQDKMTEYRPETEQLLFYLPLAGSAFRKTYYDPSLGRPTALFVPAEDFLVPYGASDLRTTPRYTHVMRRFANDIRRDMHSGFYRSIDLPKPVQNTTDIDKKKAELEGRQQTNFDLDERHTLLECHCNWDFEEFDNADDDDEGDDGGAGATIGLDIEWPYIITVDKDSQTVLSVRRNWEEDDPLRERVSYFTAYHYLPGLGFYGSGLIHLIGGIAKSATSILRQLVDAGTLSNLPGGLKTRGLRIKGDDTPIMPGEFRDVDVPSGSIRDNITFIPYKEPSEVLHGLLNDIISEGRRLGAAPDLPINAMTQQAPVGTTLALLERSMKVMSAVQARLHASLKQDFVRLAHCIAKHDGPQYEYEVDDPNANRVVDFSQVDIIPVSDPNAASMAQRVVQWQSAFQMAQTNPTAFDMPELYRQGMTILGMPNVEKIVKDPDNLQPMDPVAENMAIITGKPIKAFLWQDHEAHIKVHLAAIHDPKIAAMVGQSPQASLIMGAASAHVAEHLAFAYRAGIEKEMGVPLPAPDQPLPQDVEVQLSKTVAVAAGRLLGKDMAEAQAQQIAQQQQDPVIQQQQQELQIKMADVQRKAKADQEKALLEAAKLIQKNEADKSKQISQEKIAGAALGVKIMEDHAAYKDADKDRLLALVTQLADIQAKINMIAAKPDHSKPADVSVQDHMDDITGQ